ncbi:ABC transporter substrate-binding protein [Micromonospora sp. NPDC000316]|uniref:ABC transporter substrate-binding protein n=1 Tax=Micromonospora sp. NPDC000316 TaxID=3364216 RepID=UPI0036C4DEE2
MSFRTSRSGRLRLGGAAAASVLLLAIAACGGSDSDASSDGPIRIGLFTPLAAAVGGFGQPAADGAKLAVSEINAAGGIDGRQVELAVQDNGCTSTNGASAVESLLGDDPVAIIGGLCSDSTLAALPLVERAGVPLLIDLASNPEITKQAGEDGNKWIFRWGPNDDVTAVSAVTNLAQLGTVRTIALVTSDDSFGQGGRTAITDAAKNAGITIVSDDAMNLNDPDFAAVVARIGTKKPDAVVLWLNSGSQVANFYQQYGAAGLQSVPIAGQLDMAQLSSSTKALKGYNSAAYSASVDTPQNQAYLKAWEANGGTTANAYVGWDGYQSVQILAAALRAADEISPKGVREALKNLTYSPTIVGGTIKFDQNHQAHDKIVVEEFSESGAKTAVRLLDQ